VILVGAVVTGTGVPAGTTIATAPAGGGAGAYTTNVATTLTAVALTFTPDPAVFPAFTTHSPVPPITVSNVWTVPTFAAGPPPIWTSTLPAYIVTTPPFPAGNTWGPPGPQGGPGPPIYTNPPGAGLPHNAPAMIATTVLRRRARSARMEA
jgi:hypothetical protein